MKTSFNISQETRLNACQIRKKRLELPGVLQRPLDPQLQFMNHNRNTLTDLVWTAPELLPLLHLSTCELQTHYRICTCTSTVLCKAPVCIYYTTTRCHVNAVAAFNMHCTDCRAIF